MWYPLNRSILTLWLASAALFTLLLLGEPVEHTTGAASIQESKPLSQAVTLLAEHLPIDDPREKARVILALQLAAVVVEHRLQNDTSDEDPATERPPERARGRLPQATMPFFSFANLVHRPRESGT